jgi:TRAP transporter TAXI family solute receptor
MITYLFLLFFSTSKQEKLLMKLRILAASAFAAIAIAATFGGSGSAMAQNADENVINICVGSTKGAYHNKLAPAIADAMGRKINRINTSGSPEILAKLESGECQMGIVQRDALVESVYQPEVVATLTPEYIHLVCSTSSGISSVKDLRGNTDATIVFDSPNSGSYLTWKAMGKLDSGYDAKKGPKVTFTESKARQTSFLKSDKAQCYFGVSALPNGGVQQIGKLGGGDIKLVPVNDWDFNDKTIKVNGEDMQVYTFSEIPEGSYEGFNLGNDSATFSDTSVETLVIDAIVVLAPSFVENGDTADVDAAYEGALIAEQNLRK